MEIATERMLLRPPTFADQAAYEAIFLRPEVERWLRPAPLTPITRYDVEAMISRDIRNWGERSWGPWVCCEREGGAVVGRVGLQPTRVEGREAIELAWTVDPARQGDGLATEAAREGVAQARRIGLDSVVAMTLPDNYPSRAVAEKLGMAGEGKIVHAGLPHVLFRLALS